MNEGIGCTCEECSVCAGYGMLWFAPSGEYLGPYRPMEDFAIDELCDECNGEGVVEFCDWCFEQEDYFNHGEEQA